MPGASAFLASAAARSALKRLAGADTLTLVVGSGASAEAALPLWRDLVSGLVRVAMREVSAPSSNQTISGCVDWTLSEDGIPASAALAQACLGSSFVDVLRSTLYARGGSLNPGPTTREVARLWRQVGVKDCEVVTTNYDQLVEAALRGEGISPQRVKATVQRRAYPGQFVVRHVHGIVSQTGTVGRVVISDTDFHRMQDSWRWQEAYFRDRLRSTTCLFIGTSLSDPNLLRYLVRTGGGGQHVALFIRQGDPRWFSGDIADEVRDLRRRAVVRRWEELGVKPLHADYYMESAQFVHEIAYRRDAGPRYLPYVERLRAWGHEMRTGLLQTRNQKRFKMTQDNLQGLLREWLGTIQKTLRAHGVNQADEKLGLHLWVRDASKNSLTLWAASDRAWRDPATLMPVPIAFPSPWVAVRGFCSGVPVSESTEEQTASRWNYVTAVPVLMDPRPWGRLPVGVVTLATTATKADSALARLPYQVQQEGWDYLSRNAGDLLRP